MGSEEAHNKSQVHVFTQHKTNDHDKKAQISKEESEEGHKDQERPKTQKGKRRNNKSQNSSARSTVQVGISKKQQIRASSGMLCTKSVALCFDSMHNVHILDQKTSRVRRIYSPAKARSASCPSFGATGLRSVQMAQVQQLKHNQNDSLHSVAHVQHLVMFLGNKNWVCLKITQNLLGHLAREQARCFGLHFCRLVWFPPFCANQGGRCSLQASNYECKWSETISWQRCISTSLAFQTNGIVQVQKPGVNDRPITNLQKQRKRNVDGRPQRVSQKKKRK